jgi:hypothetical protein
MATKIDTSLLSAALVGYQAQLEEVDRKITALRARLGGARTPTASGAGMIMQKPRRKHLISAEGRARIAAAQRKRWAEMKKD